MRTVLSIVSLAIFLSGTTAALSADAAVRVRDAPVVKKHAVYGCKRGRCACPRGDYCYPLYGAYGPWGGKGYWSGYSYYYSARW